MSDLIDIRLKLSPLCNQVLETHTRADRRDKNEVAKAAVESWAAAETHRSILVMRLTRGEGSAGDSDPSVFHGGPR